MLAHSLLSPSATDRVSAVEIAEREELRRLAVLCATAGIEPAIDSTFALADATEGIRRMVGGELFGKVVFHTWKPCES